MPAPTVAEMIENPEWHAHRYDAAQDAFQFKHVSRAEHGRATFLTDQYLDPANPLFAVPRADIVAAPPPGGRTHFIFHSAFCGSTLLARAFDLPGVAMGLKEPLLFNDIAGVALRGGAPEMIAAALDTALALLARPFSPGEAVVVKPSNLASGFIPAMLAMRGEASALFLEAPLRVFLGSVARKGMEGRLWVRELLFKLLGQGLVDLGFEAEDYFKQTDLQSAGVGWLAQHALFSRILSAHPGRARSIDSERLMARPVETLTALGSLFALRIDARAIADGAAFNTHSKHGSGYDAEARRAEQAAGEAPFADEIEKVAIWTEAVAANIGLALTLPQPLI